MVTPPNPVVVVEHNTDFIAEADWVLDLGPGGGVSGGSLVAEGSPRALVTEGKGETARALAPLFVASAQTR